MKSKMFFLTVALTLCGCSDTLTKSPICEGSVVKGCQPVVYFDFDSAELTEESMKNLDWAAEKLKRWPNKHMRIIGHADQAGNDEVNMKISQKRAEAVKDYLMDAGVNPELVSIDFKGKTQQICKTNHCQDINRRAESNIYTFQNDGAWKVVKTVLTTE